MGLVDGIFRLIQFLVLCAVGSVVLLIVLCIVVSLLPDSNPVKHVLNALAQRIGIALGVTVIGIPIEFVPVIDALYDIGAVILFVYLAYTFVRDEILPAIEDARIRSQLRMAHRAGLMRDAGLSAEARRAKAEPRELELID